MHLFHFKMDPNMIVPLNLSVSDKTVSFDFMLATGFHDVSGYSYTLKGDCLFIEFYGCYFPGKFFNKSVSKVNINTGKRIKKIIGIGKNKEIVWLK